MKHKSIKFEGSRLKFKSWLLLSKILILGMVLQIAFLNMEK